MAGTAPQKLAPCVLTPKANVHFRPANASGFRTSRSAGGQNPSLPVTPLRFRSSVFTPPTDIRQSCQYDHSNSGARMRFPWALRKLKSTPSTGHLCTHERGAADGPQRQVLQVSERKQKWLKGAKCKGVERFTN